MICTEKQKKVRRTQNQGIRNIYTSNAREDWKKAIKGKKMDGNGGGTTGFKKSQIKEIIDAFGRREI